MHSYGAMGSYLFSWSLCIFEFSLSLDTNVFLISKSYNLISNSAFR